MTMAAAAIGGCIPEQPAPTSEPPVVLWAGVENNSAVAGESVTFRYLASHSLGVISFQSGPLVNPQGRTLHQVFSDCVEPVPVNPPEPTAERTVTCSLPAWLNPGTYTTSVGVGGVGGSHGSAPITFEVTGGSDDVSPPVVTSDMPISAPRGSSIPLTFTIEDENLDPTAGLGQASYILWVEGKRLGSFYCGELVRSQTSTTTMTATVTCAVPASTPTGRYVLYLSPADLNQWYRSTPFYLEVT